MKQIILGLIAFWIIAACTITPITPTVVPDPTSTAPPTATLAPTETATPSPTATPLAYRNLTSQFAWFVEGYGRMPTEAGHCLTKGTVVGYQVMMTMTCTIDDAASLPDGGWYWIPSPDFREAFPLAVDVGPAVLARGYHERGLTGGVAYWEAFPRDSKDYVLRIKYSAAANKNGRIDRIWPFVWETTDWFTTTLTYERVGGG